MMVNCSARARTFPWEETRRTLFCHLAAITTSEPVIITPGGTERKCYITRPPAGRARVAIVVLFHDEQSREDAARCISSLLRQDFGRSDQTQKDGRDPHDRGPGESSAPLPPGSSA